MVKSKVNRRDPGHTHTVGLDPDVTTSRLRELDVVIQGNEWLSFMV